jgi:hypothetical protein
MSVASKHPAGCECRATQTGRLPGQRASVCQVWAINLALFMRVGHSLLL